jgi:hypothetical protein
MEITIFVVLVVIFVIVEYYYFMKLKKEKFSNYLGYGPFKPIENENTRLVDPLVCYPGTYWRTGTYNDVCLPMNKRRKMRMSVEGERIRAPEPRYEMICSPDKHLNRNCQFVKVYNRYY